MQQERRQRTEEVGIDHESLRVERRPGTITVLVGGDVDVHRATTLRPLFRDLLLEHPDRLVIDGASIVFVDSVGLGLFIAARNQARDSGTQLVLRQPSSALRNLLEITHLTEAFDIDDGAVGDGAFEQR